MVAIFNDLERLNLHFKVPPLLDAECLRKVRDTQLRWNSNSKLHNVLKGVISNDEWPWVTWRNIQWHEALCRYRIGHSILRASPFLCIPMQIWTSLQGGQVHYTDAAAGASNVFSSRFILDQKSPQAIDRGCQRLCSVS